MIVMHLNGIIHALLLLIHSHLDFTQSVLHYLQYFTSRDALMKCYFPNWSVWEGKKWKVSRGVSSPAKAVWWTAASSFPSTCRRRSVSIGYGLALLVQFHGLSFQSSKNQRIMVFGNFMNSSFGFLWWHVSSLPRVFMWWINFTQHTCASLNHTERIRDAVFETSGQLDRLLAQFDWRCPWWKLVFPSVSSDERS